MVRLKTAEQRLAWLADHLAEQPGSGIVYCLTVAATQEVADYLRSRGHEVAAYSGQTEPTERHALEEDLLAGRVKALVATSALGMGFDATLGFVVNLGAPPSPVAYYQQVGRAGRGTDRGHRRAAARRSRTATSGPTSPRWPSRARSRSAQTLEVLADEGRPLSTAALETYVELNRTRLETMLKVLDVDGAVRRVRGGWESTGQPWAYDEERYRRVTRGPRARAAGDARLHRHRPAAGCGSCATSSTTRRPPTAAAATTAAGSTLAAEVSDRGRRGGRGPAVPARRRRSSRARCGRPRWPTSASTSRARSPRRAEEGRAVARLTDLGYGQALRELFAPATPGRPGAGAAGPGGASRCSATGARRSTAIVVRRVARPARR